MSNILEAIAREREVQCGIYSQAHDDNHRPSEWLSILMHLLGKAACNGSPDKVDAGRFRQAMIEIAATAQAAAEAIDRTAPTRDKDRMRQMAQDLADQFGEPVLVLPAGRKHVGACGTVTVEKMACCVLLSQAEPQEIGQQVMRVEPNRGGGL
jgi:hypothetical protein